MKQIGSGKMRGAGGSDNSGIADDADTTAVASGTAALTHGIMLDALRRSQTTHLTSWTSRSALFAFEAGLIPWYSPDNSGGYSRNSVAERLFMSVADAELWERGNAASWTPGTNSVARFSDMPFNPRYMARQKFFALDPEAAELDDFIMIEPQVFALDEFSQLFSESCSFHFGFLADLDAEYHRLRPLGAVGVFNETSENSPWYHLYHYWREVVRTRYLDTGLVVLPSGASTTNWTIQDVLDEIVRYMAPDGTNLLDDIYLTEKGVMKGQSTAGFGLQSDAAYLDMDGNSRMYVPWMDTDVRSGFAPDSEDVASAVSISVAGSDAVSVVWENLDTDNGIQPPSPGVRTQLSPMTSNMRVPTEVPTTNTGLDTYRRALFSLSAALRSNTDGRSTVYNAADVFLYRGQSAAQDSHTWQIANDLYIGQETDGNVLNSILDINNLPLGASLQRHTVDWADDIDPTRPANDVAPAVNQENSDGSITSYTYYTGHSLNLIQLVDMARHIGRALEPEVAHGVLPKFGLVSSVETLKNRGTGLKAKDIPTLYNMYEAGFSFNENPARDYTAAHMGPSSLVLPSSGNDALRLENVVLDSAGVTVRERYWTPSSMTRDQVSTVLGALFGRSDYAFGLFGVYSITNDAFTSWEALDLPFIARTLGTNRSMFTKVEKPIILPAGVAAADATYASGMGKGAIELVSELIHGSLDGVPRFGLGLSGFSDIAATTTASFSSSGLGGLEYDVNPTSRLDALSGEEEFGVAVVASGPYGGLFGSDLAEAIEVAPGGFDYQDTVNHDLPGFDALDVISEHGLAVLSPARAFRNGVYGPIELLSSHSAPLLTSKIIETSALDLQAQWGLPTFSSALNIQVSNNADNSFAGTTNPVVGHLFRVPLEVTFDDGSTTGHTVPAADIADYTSDNDNSSITEPDEYWSTNQAVGSPSGPVVIETSGGRRWENIVWHDGALANWFPSFTPMQMITAAYQSMVTRYASGQAPAPNWQQHADGYRYLDLEFVVQASIGGRSPLIAGQGAATTSASPTFTWNLQLRIPDETPTLFNDANVTLSTAGVFSPAIGDDFVKQPEVTVFSDCTLHFMGSTATNTETTAGLDEYGFRGTTWNTNTGAATHSPDGAQAVELVYVGTQASTNTMDDLNTPNVNLTPPVEIGGVIARNRALLVTAPEEMLAHRGQWGQAEIIAEFNPLGNATHSGVSVQRFGTSGNYYHGWIHSSAEGRAFGATPNIAVQNINTVAGQQATPTVPLPENLEATLHYVQSSQLNPGPATSLVDGAFGSFVVLSVNRSADESSEGTLSYATALAGIEWSQVSLLYPDDPKHKMLYRPWRTIVDAAIAKELRLTFTNLGDHPSHIYGPLGVETIGTPTGFRFEQLVKGGNRTARQFILEKETSKTRLTNPANRGLLTFTKVGLKDPQSQRHLIPDELRGYNVALDGLHAVHASSKSGTRVYTRDFLRDVQSGRQFQRFGN